MTVLARRPVQVPRGVIIPAGGPLLGQEYIRIYDQSGLIWYWWVAEMLAADWGATPEKSFDQEVRLYRIPWWLELRDTDSDLWYVYPEVDGSPLVSAAQPSLGVGVTNSPKLRAKNGRTRYQYTVVGGDLDVITA
jgi:hypothetical protein